MQAKHSTADTGTRGQGRVWAAGVPGDSLGACARVLEFSRDVARRAGTLKAPVLSAPITATDGEGPARQEKIKFSILKSIILQLLPSRARL